MIVVRRIAEMPVPRGVLGFVPTMGALHEGHMELVRRARRECDTVAVSIFVNPTQFNDPRDLERYPRTEAEDLALLEKEGVEIVFSPSAEEMYPVADTRTFDLGGLDSVMEGPLRPGHFNGVVQVVTRLFDIVKPARAYFGEKDFQQLAILSHIVRQQHLPVEIVPCPIVRASDGLALSSRNALLTPEQRAAAPAIYTALRHAAALMAEGVPIAAVKQATMREIDTNPYLSTEYFEIVDAATLLPAGERNGRPLRGCVAVRDGEVRLIDNIAL